MQRYHHFTDMQIWGRGLDLERFDPSLRRSEEFRRRIGVAPHEVRAYASCKPCNRSMCTKLYSICFLLTFFGCFLVASFLFQFECAYFVNTASPRGVLPGLLQVCLIWVGRLVPEKRPDIWRDVYLALLAEGLPVKGLVVGVGPCQAMFDACPGVHVAGWLNGLDLAEAYASADLLLFPSDVETFGNVTLEALGSGIPAVVSDEGLWHN